MTSDAATNYGSWYHLSVTVWI